MAAARGQKRAIGDDDDDNDDDSERKRSKTLSPFEEQMLQMVTRKSGRPPVTQAYLEKCRKEGFEFQLSSTRVDDVTGIITLFGITKERHSIAVDVSQYYYYAFIDLPAAWAADPSSVAKLDERLMDLVNGNLAALDLPPGASDPPWKKRKAKGRVVAVGFEKGQSLYGYDDGGERFFARLTVDKRNTLYQLQELFKNRPFTLAGSTWTPHVYETNIDKNTRFMVDMNIVGLGLVRVAPSKESTLVHGKESYYTTQIYASCTADTVRGVPDFDDIYDIETLFFDCEMAGRKGIFPQPEVDPVIQISAMSHIHRESDPYARYLFALGECDPIEGANVRSFKTERDMLDAFAHHVLDTDPDIISGFNINNFDLPYLIRRAEVIGATEMAFLGRTAGIPCKIQVRTFESRAFGASETKDLTRCDGRIIMDCLEWVRRDYKLRAYNLNAVCYEFLSGMTKEDVPHELITPLHNSGPAGRRRIGIYCLKDSWLPARITVNEQKIYNIAETARVCRVPPEYLFTRGQSVKVVAQLLSEAKRQRFFIPFMKSFHIPGMSVETGDDGVDIDDALDEAEIAEAKGLVHMDTDDDEAGNEDEGAPSDGEDVVDATEALHELHTALTAAAAATPTPLDQLKWTDEALKRTQKRKSKDELIDPTVAAKRPKTYTGATVLEPIRGFHRRPVICNDFSSLYPTIMMAHNTCYTTLVRKDRARPASLKEGDTEITPIKAEFVKPSVRKGLLPVILENLLGARKRAKNDMEREEKLNGKGTPIYNVYNNRQLALKVSANSIYGFTGAEVGPLPCLEIGASVTSYGRGMIMASKKHVETTYTKANGYAYDARVLYGDTDSIMIDFGVDSMIEAARLGKESAAAITAKFPKPIKLECEKGMWPFLLLEPKRYVYKEYDVDHPEAPARYKKGPKEGQEIIKAKGVGSERRDNTLFEVKVQRDIQNALMDNDPERAVAIAEDAIHRLITGKDINPFDMVLSAQWAKRKEDYKVIPTVVHLAERMAARDKGSAPQVGDRIPYVLVKTGKKKSQEKVRDMVEDPEYAISHNLPLHTEQYLKRIDHPIRQLLQMVVSKQRLHEVFNGPHTRFVVKKTQANGIAAFCTISRPCIGCKANISGGAGKRAVCDQCKASGVAEQLLRDQEAKSTSLRDKCDAAWNDCAKSCPQFTSIEEVERCGSKNCPKYYGRLALKRSAETEEETTKRLRTQLDLL